MTKSTELYLLLKILFPQKKKFLWKSGSPVRNNVETFQIKSKVFDIRKNKTRYEQIVHSKVLNCASNKFLLLKKKLLEIDIIDVFTSHY